MYDRVLVATDGSDRATRAATTAVEFADCFDATLYVLFVVETRTGYDSGIIDHEAVRENLRDVGEEALAAVERIAADCGVTCETVIDEGVPGERITAAVDEYDIDLVVIGEKGHSDFETVLLGSTAEAVVHGVDVPVTVV